MRFREFLRDRTGAQPAQRSEAAWELGWTLYNANRFADAAPAFEQSALLAPRARTTRRAVVAIGLPSHGPAAETLRAQ